MAKSDYNFLDDGFGPVELGEKVSTRSAEGRNAKIEFIDEELPATFGGDEIIDIMRQRVEMGDALIDEMGLEARAVVLKTEADLAIATEMQGQIKDLIAQLTKTIKVKSDYYYGIYKRLRGILTVRTDKLEASARVLQKKQNELAHKLRMERRREQQEAEAEARRLQEKLDAERREQEKVEIEAAKVDGREPELKPRIVVDKPVIDESVKVKTESASTTIKSYLAPVIENLGSKFILQMVMNYYRKQYVELAEKSLKAAIKAGVLGLKGADGVKVEERTKAKNIKRR